MVHSAATVRATTTGAVSITDQTQTYRVQLANAIITRSRVWADFDTAEKAFRYARENRCYFNNTRSPSGSTRSPRFGATPASLSP